MGWAAFGLKQERGWRQAFLAAPDFTIATLLRRLFSLPNQRNLARTPPGYFSRASRCLDLDLVYAKVARQRLGAVFVGPQNRGVPASKSYQQQRDGEAAVVAELG